MKSVTHIILIAVMISGCQTNPKRVPDLHYGMTHKEVDDAIRGDDLHEFSALLNGDVFNCYSIEFGRGAGAKYFFSFKNDRLIAIVRSAPFFEWEIIDVDDRKVSVQVAWDEEERIQRILAAAPLAIEDFRIDAATRVDKSLAYSKSKDKNYGILPAFIILSPIWLTVGLHQSVSEKQQEKKWAKHFNPELVRIGMSRTECDEVYGHPAFIIQNDEHETRVYGATETLRRNEGCVSLVALDKYHYWTAVRFDRNKIARIFSNHLFNEKTLVKTEYMESALANDKSSSATKIGRYRYLYLYRCSRHDVSFDDFANPHAVNGN